MCDRFWGTAWKVGVGASAIGGALYGLGHVLPCATLKTVALPFLAIGAAGFSPFALAIAGIAGVVALCVALAPLCILIGIIQSIRAWRLVRHIDRLDKRSASDEEYDAAFARVATLDPSQTAIAERVRNEDCPSRRRWLPHLWDSGTLEEVALRGSDPLAPMAWQRAMIVKHERACDVPEPQILRLWAHAVASEDPFALPPELAATKEMPNPRGG